MAVRVRYMGSKVHCTGDVSGRYGCTYSRSPYRTYITFIQRDIYHPRPRPSGQSMDRALFRDPYDPAILDTILKCIK
ncbi:unnamed protein product [Danaus chrysippus]|uniref:(African queen) hypothetical protein n=1 Tax=Danaus chrysippus TaxID=151541 RepID=A0A8J2VPF4_9NEOP|nr:unnamed protein product [Danaus chrysippus]